MTVVVIVDDLSVQGMDVCSELTPTEAIVLLNRRVSEKTLGFTPCGGVITAINKHREAVLFAESLTVSTRKQLNKISC